MTKRRPRTVLGSAAVLLAVVLGVFVIGLLESSSNDRKEVERRFAERARVSAALTESLFSLVSSQARTQNRERFGDERPSERTLERRLRQGQSVYGAILDERGEIIAASDGVTDEIRAHIESRPEDVAAALGGRPYGLSDFLDFGPSGVLQFSAPFDTDHGRRVIVTGTPAPVFGAFLAGYLGRIPDAEETTAYVIDAGGRVVGSPARNQPPGSKVREPGLLEAIRSGEPVGTFESGDQERAFAESDVENSSWRVVLSMPSGRLYATTGTAIEWLILITLLIAGLIALFLLNRMVRASAQVQEAYEELAASNAELERSTIELKRSNAELEQFASVASHDLQEPLRKVQTFGDKLEQQFGDQIPREGLDYLRRMRRASARMSALIEDLLRFSRVTTHAAPPRRVDLERIAREVTSDLDAMVQEKHAHVTIDPLPEIEADPTQMRQLLQNLIANGLKFHRPDTEPEVRIQPLPDPGDGQVAFAVSDNGIGFEEQYEERIFRVFERLHPRDVYEGTGIGLALCRKIVERHGGTITASGRPDAGATFTITLPVRQPSSNGAKPALDREHAHV